MKIAEMIVTVPDAFGLEDADARAWSLRLAIKEGWTMVTIVSAEVASFPLGGDALDVHLRGTPPADWQPPWIGIQAQVMPPPDLYPERFATEEEMRASASATHVRSATPSPPKSP